MLCVGAKCFEIIMEEEIHFNRGAEIVEEFAQVVRFKLDPKERLGQMNIATVWGGKAGSLPTMERFSKGPE